MRLAWLFQRTVGSCLAAGSNPGLGSKEYSVRQVFSVVYLISDLEPTSAAPATVYPSDNDVVCTRHVVHETHGELLVHLIATRTGVSV